MDDPYCEFMVQENKASFESFSAMNLNAVCCAVTVVGYLHAECSLTHPRLPPTPVAGHWPRVADSRQPVGLLARALDAAACL